MIKPISSIVSVSVSLLVLAVQLVPQVVIGGTVIGGAGCTPGPNPCRSPANAVSCIGTACATLNWDECIIANEGVKTTCKGDANPAHCNVPGCTAVCGEWCT
jgi:hypothetical protein